MITPEQLWDFVVVIAKAFLGDDYEDAAGDICLKVVAAGTWTLPFVRVVAQNTCRDALRRRRARQKHEAALREISKRGER